MACILNPAFWVYLVVVIAGVMIMKIVVPWIVAFFELPPPLAAIISIILWAVIACMGIYFLFGLLSCLFSTGSGLAFPTFPHR
jgi:hypothetical protein